MAQIAIPFDSVAVAEGEWQKMARHWLGTGVIDGRLNGLAVTAGSGMQVSVASGAAWLIGFFYETDGPVTVNLNPAHATLPRLDRIVVKLDRTANTITLTKVTGTPAGSPALPALTQTDNTYELPLATVAVAAAVGSIVNADITDARVYAGAARFGGKSPADFLQTTGNFGVGGFFTFYSGINAALIQDGGQRVYSPLHPAPLSRAIMDSTKADTGFFNSGAYADAGPAVTFTAGPSGTFTVDIRGIPYINSGNFDTQAHFGFNVYDNTTGLFALGSDDSRAQQFEIDNPSGAGVLQLPSLSYVHPVTGMTEGHSYTVKVTAKGTGGWFLKSSQVLVLY